jgi:septal ring factor EnvC (AmiA/AmiB activator)
MHKIEDSVDLIEWSKGVNTCLNNKLCDYQDIFARSNIETLKDAFNVTSCNQNDFNLVIFSIQKAMGSETIVEYMKFFARVKAEKYIKDESDNLDERFNAIVRREKGFELRREQLEATIKSLEHQNAELTKDNKEMSKELSDKVCHIMDIKEEIAKQQRTINELEIFKKHVKELIAK